MRFKRLSACLLTLAMLLSLCGNAFAVDSELTITTKKLPTGEIKKAYSATVEASGGREPYKFRLENPDSVPTGIVLSENGEFSGTPLKGGKNYSNVEIIVEDADGNIASKVLSLYISAQNVKFVVGTNRYKYDGKPHKALDIVPYVNNQDMSETIEYTVTYNGEEEQTEVGAYPIMINITTPGFRTFSTTPYFLYIDPNDNVNISYIGTTFLYDGSPKTPTVLATGRYTEEDEWFNLECTKTYTGLDVEYSSAEPPTEPGAYRISCTVSDPNFTTPYEMSSTTFTITRSTLNFTLNDQSPYNKGEEWNRRYVTADGIPETDYEVKYVKDGVSSAAPTEVGDYDVQITLKGETANQYEVGIVTPSRISVGKENVTVTVSDREKEYTGSAQQPTFTVSKNGVELDVTYTDAEGNAIEGAPVKSGTYNITVTARDSDNYMVSVDASTLIFTITPITVKFTTDALSYTYNQQEHTPNITTEPSISPELYKVKYRKTTNPDELLESIREVGRYDLAIELTDTVNYRISTESTIYVSVAEVILDFEVSNLTQTYDGTPKEATVVAYNHGTHEVHMTECYDIVYRQGDTIVDKPTNAGTYRVTVAMRDGHGRGDVRPNSPNYLVIEPKAVTFTASDTSQKHSVDGVTATITPEEGVPEGSYKVQYRKQGTADTPTDKATDVGTYDIIVTMTDTNYTTDFTGTLTVTDNIVMNYGNTPMGMIYRDPRAQNNEWRYAAISGFANSGSLRHFAEGYVPEGCNSDGVFPAIEANIGHYDQEENTLIVKDINDFASVDPGIMVNGTLVKAIDSPVKHEYEDNVYTVTYTDTEFNLAAAPVILGTRTVIEIGKIGDVNGDGVVNATDANVLDHLTSDMPNNVTQARVWDVNKDGKIDGNDARAIRSRFKTKLVPYYPWVK